MSAATLTWACCTSSIGPACGHRVEPYEPFALWDMSGPRYERIVTAETLTELWKRITPGHVVIKYGFEIVAFHDDMLARVEEWGARAPWN